MKNILFVLLLCSFSLYAQEIKTHRIETTFSYGAAFIDYGGSQSEELLDLGIPSIGSFYELNIDFVLTKNRHIGVGFSRQQHSNRVDDSFILNNTTGIVLENYKNIHQKDFFDIHFRKSFDNNLQFTVGAFYFIEDLNTASIFALNETPIFLLENEKNRSDNFGLFGALEYFHPIRSNIEIGIKTKLYISLNGVETVALLPSLRLNI